MATVSLVPDSSGNEGVLSVDGTTILKVQVGHNGHVQLFMPDADVAGVSFSRNRPTPTGQASGFGTDGNDVWCDLPDKPRITIPVEQGTPEYESPGAYPLLGQDVVVYDTLYALLTRTNMCMFGPTGCGKTALIEWLTHALGWNCVVLSITPGANEDTMVGTQLPAAHEQTGAPTVAWYDRQIAKAVRASHNRPTVLLIDEINRIRDVNEYASLMPLLDGTASLTLSTGEVIDRGDLVLVATANPPHEYVGTNELDPAFENRLQWTPTIDYPDPIDEALALTSRITTLDPATARAMTDVASRIRRAAEITHPLGFRSLETWARAMDSGFYTWSEAAERSLVAKFPEDERQAVRNVLAMFQTDESGAPLDTTEVQA